MKDKKHTFRFLALSLAGYAYALVLLFSCQPGERPKGSSTSETALSDTIISRYSDDTLHKYKQDSSLGR